MDGCGVGCVPEVGPECVSVGVDGGEDGEVGVAYIC